MESRETNRSNMGPEIQGFEKLWKEGLGNLLKSKDINHIISVTHPYDSDETGYRSHTMVIGVADIVRCPQSFVVQVAILSQSREAIQRHRLAQLTSTLIGRSLPKALCNFSKDEEFMKQVNEHVREIGAYCRINDITYACAILVAYDEESNQIISSYGLSSFSPPHYFLSHWIQHLLARDKDDKVSEIISTWERSDDWIDVYHDELQEFEDADTQEREEHERIEGESGFEDRTDITADITRRASQKHLEDEGVSQTFEEPVDKPDNDLAKQVRKLLGLIGDVDANDQ